jgi:septum site-determining protein MinD
MVGRGDMMSKDDVVEILAIDLIGVVPDDESIITSTNRGEVAVLNNQSSAGRAYTDIARRLRGEDVPLVMPTEDRSWLERLFGAIGLRPKRAVR